jgi:hypothetical protein
MLHETKRKKDHAPVEMAYVLENQKWVNANKKCMAFTKNTIENAIAGSIAECTSVAEFLEKIKSQYWLFKGVCYPAAQTASHRKVHRRCTWHQGAHPEDAQYGF